MKTQSLQFKVNKYRSIHKASIDIKGMTVLTGPSDSGKTTLLVVLNQMLTCVIRYESMAKEEEFVKMNEIERILYNLIAAYENERIRHCLRKPYKGKGSLKKYWEKLLNELQEIYEEEYPLIDESLAGKRKPSKKIYRNIKFGAEHYLKNLRKIVCPEVDYKKLELPDLINFIREYCAKIITIQEDRIRSRTTDYLPDIFKKLYRQEMEEVEFQISQGNLLIASNKLPSVGKIDVINNVYYMTRIDKIFGYDYCRTSDYFINDSWFGQKGNKLANIYPGGEDKEIREFLHTILKGELSLEEYHSERRPKSKPRSFLVYKRQDGMLIPLHRCGSGLKTFFVFHRMLDKGLLTKDKLIIFDQPESFLSSERIVQFARLVCLIQKRLGVKFLFATNLREMIEALENAAIEYELGDTFCLYESKEGKSPFQYEYQLVNH